MKMNSGSLINKGQTSALLVPASATREAASALYKGLAASSGKNTRRGGKIKLSNKVIS